MPRLTKLEKQMLHRAAHLVLAGEWPWEGDGSTRANRKEEREQEALQSAAAKLESTSSLSRPERETHKEGK